MKKEINIAFVFGFLLIVFGMINIVILIGQLATGNLDIINILNSIYFILGIDIIKMLYQLFLTVNRESIFLSTKFNYDEMVLLYDAVTLIESVDNNYKFAEFSVYKVKFIRNGWHYFDEETGESNIFIPFRRYIKYNNEYLFVTIVHEILHSQNLKNNIIVFNNDFLEGLNEYLTEWLIENYSIKYKLTKIIKYPLLYLGKGKALTFNSHINIYKEQVDTVKKVLDDAHVDIKEVFINYINFNPEFFEKFVPEEYYIDDFV